MNEKQKKELAKQKKIVDIKLKYKKYLPKKITDEQLNQLIKIIDAQHKTDTEKILKSQLQIILSTDEINTKSFLINVPDKVHDSTKLPKGTKSAFKERILEGILNITSKNYLNFSPMGIQQYVGITTKQIKEWLNENENENEGGHTLNELWNLLKYKFEFNQGKAIVIENIKNYNVNPNMFDFGMGSSVFSEDTTYENNEINFDELTQNKIKEKENEWNEFKEINTQLTSLKYKHKKILLNRHKENK